MVDEKPSRPALRYYGSKWNLAPWIISYFPPHTSYVEPCGGGASVLLQKYRSPLETYNDLDGNVVNFFRVLRERTNELIKQLELTPWAREEFEICRNPCEDPLESARRFFFSGIASQSNQSHDKNSGMRNVYFAEQCYSPAVTNGIGLVDNLHIVANRLRGVQIENDNALTIIEKYNHENSLLYFDPPYLQSTRSKKKQYLIEPDEQFHIDAAELLNQYKGFVIVSGYESDLYKSLYEERGWTRVDRKAKTNSGGERIELLWLNEKTAHSVFNDYSALPLMAWGNRQ